METAEIKRRWLQFFGERGHTVVPSASLLLDDPNLLFVNAGMVPFKPYLLGQETPPYQRATSVQKCVRTLDIEEVGKTTRHGTFFQMNGNFSFGDYFKEGAIELAWELVTGSQADGRLRLRPGRRSGSPSTRTTTRPPQLWRKVAGLPEERIQRRGLADNYWHMGVPGPGGPCSEIYIDRGPEYGPDGGPIVDEDRFLEIWNLVFMQEELGAVRSKVDFDVLGAAAAARTSTPAWASSGSPTCCRASTTSTRSTRSTRSSSGRPSWPASATARRPHERRRPAAGRRRPRPQRADAHQRRRHARATRRRGYVLRRLLRRTVRSMRLLGVEDPVLPELLPISRDAMAPSYPELADRLRRGSRRSPTPRRRRSGRPCAPARRSSTRRSRETKRAGRHARWPASAGVPAARHLRLPDRPDPRDGRRAGAVASTRPASAG